MLDTQVEVLLADLFGEVGPGHGVAHRTFYPGEQEPDALPVQIVGHFFEGVGGAGVDVIDAFAVDDHGLQGFSFALYQLGQGILEEVDICKIELRVEAEDQQIGALFHFLEALDIAVVRRTRHFAQYGDVRAGGAEDDHHQRQHDADSDPLLDAQAEGGQEGNDQHEEIGAVGVPQVHGFLDIDQPEYGHHDHRGENGLRQVVEQGRQKEQGQQDQRSADDGRQSGARSGLIVDGRPRESSGSGVGLKERAAHIGQAQGDQLLIGDDLVVLVFSLNGFSYGDAFHKTDQGDGQGDRHERAGRSPAKGRQFERGESLWHGTHDLHSFPRQTEQPDGQDAENDGQQRTGDGPTYFFYQQDQADTAQPDQKGRPM